MKSTTRLHDSHQRGQIVGDMPFVESISRIIVVIDTWPRHKSGAGGERAETDDERRFQIIRL